MAAEEKSKLQRRFRADRYWLGFFFPESHILSSPYLPFHMRKYFPPPVNRSSCTFRRSSPAVCIRALHISHHQPRHMVSAFPLNRRGNYLPQRSEPQFRRKRKKSAESGSKKSGNSFSALKLYSTKQQSEGLGKKSPKLLLTPKAR